GSVNQRQLFFRIHRVSNGQSRYIVLFGHPHVICTECRGNMDNTGSFISRYKITDDYFKSISIRLYIRHQLFEADAGKRFPLHFFHDIPMAYFLMENEFVFKIIFSGFEVAELLGIKTWLAKYSIPREWRMLMLFNKIACNFYKTPCLDRRKAGYMPVITRFQVMIQGITRGYKKVGKHIFRKDHIDSLMGIRIQGMNFYIINV